MDTLFHVGMDVHLSGIHAVVLAGEQVEPDGEQTLPYDFAKFRKPFERLLARLNGGSPRPNFTGNLKVFSQPDGFL